MLNEQQFNLFGQIQTSQTGGQPDSDTSLWFSAFISIVFFNVSLRVHQTSIFLHICVQFLSCPLLIFHSQRLYWCTAANAFVLQQAST